MSLNKIFSIILLASVFTVALAMLLKHAAPSEFFRDDIETSLATEIAHTPTVEGDNRLIVSVEKNDFGFEDNEVYFSFFNSSEIEQKISANIFFPTKKIHVERVEILVPTARGAIRTENLALNKIMNQSRLAGQNTENSSGLTFVCSFSAALKGHETKRFRAIFDRPNVNPDYVWIEAIGDRGAYGLVSRKDLR